MSIRNPVRFGLPVLLVALGAAAGCKGVPQPPQVDTAGMRVDVQRARQSRKGIDVSVRIWNDHDQPVSFENGNVRLMFGDREVSATASRMWGRARNPSVQAKGHQDFRWVFVVGEDLQKGQNYKIEIRDLMRDEVPMGDTAVFQISL